LIRSYPLTRYERVTEVDFALCASKNSSCAKMKCPDHEDEVCGNDGVTYLNSCHLRKVTCTKGVHMSHVGGCSDLSKVIDIKECPKKCESNEIDGGDEEIICGSDGNVYKYVIRI
jgi:hypothetical protein